MLRTTVTILTLLLLVPVATADVVILRKGKKLQFLGIKSKIGDTEITLENIELFIEKSTGVIDREGYDGLDFRKSLKAKNSKTYAWGDVVKHYYHPEPVALQDGYDQMRLGAYAQAIRSFREVITNPEERDVFKPDAYFRIGYCYYSAGNLKSAIGHLSNWRWQDSTYTPEVKRFLAEIYISRRQFTTARDQFNQIAALPGIPANWKYKAELGNVKVDIAERKYADAERKAKSIAGQTTGTIELADANVLAHILQAQAILQSDAADRLPEAEALLEKAADVKGAPNVTRANLFATLGDVQYKQGKLEEARFPYMRVALMYPDQPAYVAHALFNAGQCFLDMSGRAADDQAKSDKYLVSAMKLFAQCAGRYRGQPPAVGAAKAYRANKKRYEEIRAKEEAGAGGSKGAKGATPKEKAK
ncbi:MAG: tetratricopeptide repeat protein [Planctomycetota bacterium]|jgi:tetratricopeptide (TPR) repeat protein